MSDCFRKAESTSPETGLWWEDPAGRAVLDKRLLPLYAFAFFLIDMKSIKLSSYVTRLVFSYGEVT